MRNWDGRRAKSAVSSAAPVHSANPLLKTTPPIVTPPTRIAIYPWNMMMTVHVLLPTLAPTATAEESIVIAGSPDVDQNVHQARMHTRRCRRRKERIRYVHVELYWCFFHGTAIRVELPICYSRRKEESIIPHFFSQIFFFLYLSVSTDGAFICLSVHTHDLSNLLLVPGVCGVYLFSTILFKLSQEEINKTPLWELLFLRGFLTFIWFFLYGRFREWNMRRGWLEPI